MITFYLFIIILSSYVQCDICGFQLWKLYPYDDVLDCLRKNYPRSDLETPSNLIDIVKKYYENNMYIDYFKHPPSNFLLDKGFDLIADLDELFFLSFTLYIYVLRKKVDYTNTFDLYHDIAITVNKLKDCHAQFFPPCLFSL
jgi:hypothetical protein